MSTDFIINCAKCVKPSIPERWEFVNGRHITDVIASVGFQSRTINLEDGSHTIIAYCSKWCRWRHGRTTGIHRVLNVLGL